MRVLGGRSADVASVRLFPLGFAVLTLSTVAFDRPLTLVRLNTR